jgi:hypothetical protein
LKYKNQSNKDSINNLQIFIRTLKENQKSENICIVPLRSEETLHADPFSESEHLKQTIHEQIFIFSLRILPVMLSGPVALFGFIFRVSL